MASSHEFETKPSIIIVNYKECRRNYAISVGGHAVDGCREFASSGEIGTEQAFLCQACGCHRSFHRKEVIKNGVVYSTPLPPPPPPSAVALGQPVFSTVPYVVFHPVEYNYSTMPVHEQPPGESHDHDDHQQYHPQQNDHGSATEDMSEMNPNGFMEPKMEPF